jgi:hypothetical protein
VITNRLALLIAALLALTAAAFGLRTDGGPKLIALGGAAPDGPRELGRVHWLRDYDEAIAASKQTGRPIFLLFQEVPGCQTCVNFGSEPLSHPLLVEAIEDAFVPLAIHNNKPGRDEKILKRFGEPSWNNPVVRLINDEGADLIPRQDGIYDTGRLASRMATALRKADRPVPGYLTRLAAEQSPGLRAKATFAMYCFWEGEAKLGALDGVIATRAAWVDRHEVVEVTYDAKRISYDRLLAAAREMKCAGRVFTHDDAQHDAATEAVGDAAARLTTPARDAKPSDRTHALRRTPLRYLPLTPMQATKVNAAIARGDDPSPWLSPRQRAMLDRIERLLAADPKALRGFQRPDDGADLPAYTDRLNRALTPATTTAP